MELLKDQKLVFLKIVYYGPGLCGKTTNLHQIFKRLLPEQKMSEEILEVPTHTDKTLSFDFMPLAVGKVGKWDYKLQFYTVPGQVHYRASRKIILQGVDGLVFVADSQLTMKDENIRTLQEMKDNLRSLEPASLKIENQKWDKIPTVLQFNKRDLPNVMSVDEMAKDLQLKDEPWFEASALTGEGVMETMQTIVRTTIATVEIPR